MSELISVLKRRKILNDREVNDRDGHRHGGDLDPGADDRVMNRVANSDDMVLGAKEEDRY